MKLFLTFIIISLALAGQEHFLRYKPNVGKIDKSPSAVSFTLKERAAALKRYAVLNNYNVAYCFMMDMRIPSGKKRFFVYNLLKDSIELSGMVANGCGRAGPGQQVQFSNDANSLCTSLGRYKVGGAYNGRFGLAFKLYGLDKSNSNAFNRFVVLHAHSCVPYNETAPLPICESWGCPTVATPFLNQLRTYIDKSAKPLLLLIYY